MDVRLVSTEKECRHYSKALKTNKTRTDEDTIRLFFSIVVVLDFMWVCASSVRLYASTIYARKGMSYYFFEPNVLLPSRLDESVRNA